MRLSAELELHTVALAIIMYPMTFCLREIERAVSLKVATATGTEPSRNL